MNCRKCKREIPDDSVYCGYCGIAQSPKKGRKLRGNGTGTAYKRGNTWTAVAIMGWKQADNNNDNGNNAESIEDIVGKRIAKTPIKRTKGGFKTKREALEYIPTLKGKKQEHTTLASIYQGWSTSAMLKLSGSKQTAYKIAYEKIKSIVNINIEDLTIDNLQKVISEKAPTYYPAKDIKTLLSHLYKRAIAQQYVTVNLSDYLILPDLNETEQTPFNEKELKNLWEDYGNGNKFTGYILLMIYSGMMPGELLNAKKDMINWDEQKIIGAGMKTKKRKETPLVIADIILPVLADLCEYSKGKKILCMNKDNFYVKFKETLEHCKCRPLPPYSCRHTTATALALGDIAPSVIQEIMRHSKFATTQRYIHVDTTQMLAAINKILEKKNENAENIVVQNGE